MLLACIQVEVLEKKCERQKGKVQALTSERNSLLDTVEKLKSELEGLRSATATEEPKKDEVRLLRGESEEMRDMLERLRQEKDEMMHALTAQLNQVKGDLNEAVSAKEDAEDKVLHTRIQTRVKMSNISGIRMAVAGIHMFACAGSLALIVH